MIFLKLNLILRSCIFMVFLLLITGCVSQEEKPEPTYFEDRSLIDTDEVFFKIHQNELDKKLKILKNDPLLTRYLEKIIEKIKNQIGFFQHSPVEVKIHLQREDATLNFAVPGFLFFFSIELLHSFEFESELAAYIAVQFAYLENRVFTAEEFNEKKGSKTFRQYLLSDPTTEKKINALNSVVKTLYQAGYDPRSLTGLWKVYKKIKYIDENQFDQLQLKTFKEISYYSPLKDPVIQTTGFNQFKKRVAQLK